MQLSQMLSLMFIGVVFSICRMIIWPIWLMINVTWKCFWSRISKFNHFRLCFLNTSDTSYLIQTVYFLNKIFLILYFLNVCLMLILQVLAVILYMLQKKKRSGDIKSKSDRLKMCSICVKMFGMYLNNSCVDNN